MSPDLPPLPAGVPRNSRHRVANALNSTAIHVLRSARTVDRETGLSAERLSLLSVLVFGGPATMSSLARAEQVSRPAITRTVRALEQAGLVRRDEVAEDRRQSRVSATSAGRRLLEAGRRARIERLAGVLEDAHPEELAELDRALAVVRRALRATTSRATTSRATTSCATTSRR
ncbi:MAG TPA: MarR family transcriptional regulator [Actinomycetes bacterium]|nr:MarR family transcriptional regulator [Actinomycetes bacterium]